MTFLAPWLLLGVLAAAVPLLLHLRRARRTRKITFSTTRFFDEQFLRAARRARFQDRLVMLLRMLLLALLALALAQPLLRSSRLPGWLGDGTAPRELAIVLDDSASMAATSETGASNFERARAAALAVIDELSPTRGDRATLVLAGQRDAGPLQLFERPTTDLAAVRDALRAAVVTDLATDLESAIALAAGLDGGGAGERREVHVFSDLQAAALSPTPWADAAATRSVLLLAPLRAAAPENISVDAVQYSAAQPIAGLPFTFRAMLTHHGRAPVTVTVRLLLEDQTISERQVELEPGRSSMVRFVHRFSAPGWVAGRIEIVDAGVDVLAADNARHLALHVRPPLQLLAINGAPSQVPARDELFFFRLALAGAADTARAADGSTVRLDEVAADALRAEQLEGHAVVLMANVPLLTDEALLALEHRVDAGARLLIALGDRVDPSVYAAWSGSHRLHGGLLPGRILERVGTSDDGAPAAGTDTASTAGDFIAAIDPTHPALAPFADGSMGSLSHAALQSYFRIDPGTSDVLMRSGAGDAILLEKPFGRGRVLMLATSLDRDWNDLPLQVTYVPLMHRLMTYLAGPGVERGHFVRTGQELVLPGSAAAVAPMQVQRPDGQIAYPQPDASTPTGSARFDQTQTAGVYRVTSSAARGDAAPQMLFAANIPHGESRLAPLEEGAIADALAGSPFADAWAMVDEPEMLTSAAGTVRQGYELWDQLLILALLVGLLEPWIANWLSRRKAMPAGDALDQRDAVAPPAVAVQERPAA